jgi:hypothetical protein
MKHINELSNILNKHFNWHKSRIELLAEMLKGIIAVRTVNLKQIALTFASKAKSSSSYRRIQRFFKDFDFDPIIILRFIFSTISMDRKLILILDRTNWKLGKTHINLLVLSIAYQGISIPVYWINLSRGGNASIEHRMFCIFKFIIKVGKKRIKYILGDREFIGAAWFDWLLKSNIKFFIRIRNNTMLKKYPNDPYPIPVKALFRKLKNSKRKFLSKIYFIGNCPVYLSSSRAPNESLLVVASSSFSRKSLRIYKIRWKTENLFSCMKTKGFNLEATHMKNHMRLEKLFFILTLTFIWAYLIGIERQNKRDIKVKKHGRKSISIFRYGYDDLRRAFFKGIRFFRKYYVFLLPSIKILPGDLCYV